MAQTILLIEDDPLSARLAELILKSEGYTVLVARNGLEGLKIAQETAPDLVILDLMLPGIDGFEVLNRLRSDPKTAGLCVAIVSSKSQPSDMDTATKIGANAYVTKPYHKDQLLETIRSLLAERETKAPRRGRCTLLLGARGDEATRTAVYTGLALAGQGEPTIVVDLRPFSVEHAALLKIPALPTPTVCDPETLPKIASLTMQGPSGLRLLHNLEGSGAAGQLTPQDAAAILDALLAEGGSVLVDMPLYPADILQSAAERCDQVLLVTRTDSASLATARSALTLMERAGIDASHTRLAIVCSPGEEESAASLEREVVSVIPPDAQPDDPAFRDLAGKLQNLKANAGGME